MSIVIKNLNFSYDGVNNVLEDINLCVDKPQIVAIVGKTGCGKTTLVQIIAGLLNADEGTVFVDGYDIFSKKYNICNLRQKLGILFQNPERQLFEQNVFKDVSFALKNSRLSKNEKEKSVKWALDCVGLDYDKFKEKSPFALSGGEKRKVAIAGVLVVKPKYLVLDEATAGLDPFSRDEFMKLLVELKKQGTTVLMVSHNMDCIVEYADRVVVIENKKIISDDTPLNTFLNNKTFDNLKIGNCIIEDIVKMLKNRGVNLDIQSLKYADLLQEIKTVING